MATPVARAAGWRPRVIAPLVTALVVAVAACGKSTHVSAGNGRAEGGDAEAVRTARTAQNQAIAALDTAAVASFWTEDVEIRRGLGVLVTGRDAYKRLFNPDSGAIAGEVYVALTCSGAGCASAAAP